MRNVQDMEGLFEDALARGDILEYLAGYACYGIEAPCDAAPTDTIAAFRLMETHLCTDEKVRRLVLDGLVVLADDEERGWIVMEYLDYLFALQGKMQLRMISDAALSRIADSLLANRSVYEKMLKWSGRAMENGIWGIVECLNRVIEAEYGVNVLAMRGDG
jgi:hypothetical protein